ncbi:hypothetical protein EGJ86_19395 [Pseudomonas sp. o96-267]|nr:hypothetical protein EGJ86_19395 [Pseudomonas sp. o96-267]
MVCRDFYQFAVRTAPHWDFERQQDAAAIARVRADPCSADGVRTLADDVLFVTTRIAFCWQAGSHTASYCQVDQFILVRECAMVALSKPATCEQA